MRHQRCKLQKGGEEDGVREDPPEHSVPFIQDPIFTNRMAELTICRTTLEEKTPAGKIASPGAGLPFRSPLTQR
jgi:hypothetical protein